MKLSSAEVGPAMLSMRGKRRELGVRSIRSDHGCPELSLGLHARHTGRHRVVRQR